MNKHSSIHVALSLSLVALSAGMSRDAFAGTAAGKVRVPTQVSVFDFGAKGDGATDDTVAIQAAINYLDTLKPHLVSSSGTATAPGTGGVVVMPPGVYYVAGPLLIGNSVTLKGSFTGPHSGVSLSGTMVAMGGGVKSNALSSGTVLLTNYGAGDPTSSQLGFINLGDSATLDGVTILYQRPNADDTSHYQWTIKSGFGVDPSNPSIQGGVTVRNVYVANSYALADFATNKTFGFTIENLYAQTVQGIQVDQNSDYSIIRNVRFSNVWSGLWQTDGFSKSIYDNGWALKIAKADGLILEDIQAFRMNQGILFYKSAAGEPWVTGSNIILDSMKTTGISCQTTAGYIGVNLSNVQIGARNGIIVGDGGSGGHLNISNAQIQAVNPVIIHNNTVTLSNALIYTLSPTANSTAVLVDYNGALNLSGATFSSTGGQALPAVTVVGAGASAVVSGSYNNDGHYGYVNQTGNPRNFQVSQLLPVPTK